MRILLSDVSKRFNRDWIFRKFSYNFNTEHKYAITGPNGSGKSTLLQVIGGAIAMSEGEIKYEVRSTKVEGGIQNSESGIQKSEVRSQKSESGIQNSKPGIQNLDQSGRFDSVDGDKAFQYISIAAPYLDVIEEMTANEFLRFHYTFKPFLQGCQIPMILSMVGLQNAANKQIRYYSSGMKQRIKLAQAIFSNTPAILLDEPCTNLDEEGVQLYHQLINDYCNDRLVIVSSNDLAEYGFCDEIISILDYKKG
jgi:ABC-type multidrug transport system ATPase subunit